MADSEVRATLRGGEQVKLRIEVGDGLAGYWTVLLQDKGRPVRRWEGRSDDLLPDEVVMPAVALRSGSASISWTVLLFGPSQRASYHVQVRLSEDGDAIIRRPVRLRGQVPPRETKLLSGVISVSDAG